MERHVNGTGPPINQGGDGSGSNAALAAISKEALQAFRTSLEDKCPIPLDLLDLLDVPVQQPFGLNPQCYARGLMKESMRQLAGLERRKRALDMLANAIKTGMDDRSSKETDENGVGKNESVGDEKTSAKRKSDGLDESENVKKKAKRT